jgi:prepilin-type N-terminal cleavage/methylation domain-containing protein
MKKTKLKSAYSLLELSIVIIIISILISGAMSVSVSGVNSAKVRATKDRMQEIYKALGNYLIANRRLPCPASLRAIESSDANYGVEVGVGAGCVGSGVYASTVAGVTTVYGAVPVKALGLSNEMAKDAFDSKIVYFIHPNFTNASPAVADFDGAVSFSNAPFTNIITVDEVPSTTAQTITADAIVVLISHGANKAGAFNANSNTQNPRSSDDNEMENDIANVGNGGADLAEYDNTIIAAAGNSDVFDDIVLYKRRNDFVEDFKAMFLIPCDGSSPTFTSDDAYYGQIVRNTACAAPSLQRRKCEAYGAWVNIESVCM